MEVTMKYKRAFSAMALLGMAALGLSQEQAKGRRYVATVGQDGIQRVEMTGGSYYFDPAEIVVKVNVPVELIIKKVGGAPHSIALKAPEAGINFETSLGAEPKVIRFTPTKAGKYPFWCTKKAPFSKSHREHGMEGMLEVVE
jgi:plastocyanin domain-containing protein